METQAATQLMEITVAPGSESLNVRSWSYVAAGVRTFSLQPKNAGLPAKSG
jgi:hypothetical protein